MPTGTNSKSAKNKNKSKDSAKLILIGNNKLQANKVKKFAASNQLLFYSYSEEEWATLEEIDQYIQEEEFSKSIIALPVGKRPVFSLNDVEGETIKRVLKKTNGNMVKAARVLKIARATLYRKMEQHGLKLKVDREKELKSLKKAA